MARCCKCGRVCGTDYESAFRTGAAQGKSNYLCKACWERQRKDAADFMKGLGYLFVHLVLPLIGIGVLYRVCQIAAGALHERLDCPEDICQYVWLGAFALLSIPLVLKVFKTLLKMWGGVHWFIQVVLCICCPPLILLPIIQLLIKIFRRR